MTDDNCLFCKIVAGKIPVQRLLEDEAALAFPDLDPQAPTHVLIVPKEHIGSLNQVTPEQWPLIGRVHALAARVAEQKGISQTGYRTLFNTGRDANQTVFHLHLHLLGGRALGWPPG